jgi:hypothetical protein
MTEAEWRRCRDPRKVFDALALGPALSDRKLLLFCVHCCFFNLGETNPDTATCEFADLWRVTERYADDRADEAELRDAWNLADEDEDERTWPLRPWVWAEKWVDRNDGLGYAIKDATVVRLLREIFGNPFRPAGFDPVLRTTDVMLLARGIDAERAFDRMPILADALQDAGCANEELLLHFRDVKQVHVRGCWALDLVLGKV